MALDRTPLQQPLARMSRASEFRPLHSDAFNRLGQIYQRHGHLPEALQAYNEAQRLDPQDARIYQAIANLYTTQSNFVEASRALQKAVELAPERPLFRRLLASSYQDQGRFTDPETALRTSLKQESSAATLVLLGHVLLYQKREADAIPPLSQAVTLNSRYTLSLLYSSPAYHRT